MFETSDKPRSGSRLGGRDTGEEFDETAHTYTCPFSWRCPVRQLSVLSWFAFATAEKHVAIRLQFEHPAAFAQNAHARGDPASLRGDGA